MRKHLGNEVESDDENQHEENPPKKTKEAFSKTAIEDLRKELEDLKREHSKCLKEIHALKEEVKPTKKNHDDENNKSNEERVLLILKQTGFTRVGPHCQSQRKMTK